MRAVNLFGAALALLLAAVPLAPARADNKRIVAVGDIHGDKAAFDAILTDAGLIDAKGKWVGGKTIFVQTGDIPDRGPETLKIMRAMMKLEKQARRKGGRVVALIGNHEAMNMLGDLRYVAPEDFAAFRTKNSGHLRDKYFAANRERLLALYGGALGEAELRAKFEAEFPLGYVEHRLAWAATGELGRWVVKHDAVAKIGDTLFAHGGFSDSLAGKSIDDINGNVRAALEGTGPTDILTDEGGPLWYRGNAEESVAGEGEVDRALADFGAKRLVIGHTPQLSGIRALYGGKVIVIDTGATAAFGGTRSWLEIEGDKATAHDDGRATPIATGEEIK